ncbi:MAG: hypothetical protein P4L84_33025 [Isosphaeraceae bacterium]|nr:hypothetical protein [Isosphaeraceae bacterium]
MRLAASAIPGDLENRSSTALTDADSLNATSPTADPALVDDLVDGQVTNHDGPGLRTLNGWVKIQNAAVADPNLSDRALRLWLALDKWAARKGWPSNAQLARECGWFVGSTGQPAVKKVKDAFDDLEKLGHVKRRVAQGSRHRTSLDLTRPGDLETVAQDSNDSEASPYKGQPLKGPAPERARSQPPEEPGLAPTGAGAGPYKGHRERIEDFEQKVESNSRTPAREKSPDQELEPFESGPETSAPPTVQGPPSRRQQMENELGCLPGDDEPDEAILAETRAFCDRWFPMRDDFQTGIRLHRRQYPSAWMLKALRRIVAKGSHERCGWGLARKILIDWRTAGSPDRGPENELDGEMRPIPRSQRTDAPAKPGGTVDRPAYLAPAKLSPEQQALIERLRIQDEARERELQERAEQAFAEGFDPLAEIQRTIQRKQLRAVTCAD